MPLRFSYGVRIMVAGWQLCPPLARLAPAYGRYSRRVAVARRDGVRAAAAAARACRRSRWLAVCRICRAGPGRQPLRARCQAAALPLPLFLFRAGLRAGCHAVLDTPILPPACQPRRLIYLFIAAARDFHRPDRSCTTPLRASGYWLRQIISATLYQPPPAGCRRSHLLCYRQRNKLSRFAKRCICHFCQNLKFAPFAYATVFITFEHFAAAARPSTAAALPLCRFARPCCPGRSPTPPTFAAGIILFAAPAACRFFFAGSPLRASGPGYYAGHAVTHGRCAYAAVTPGPRRRIRAAFALRRREPPFAVQPTAPARCRPPLPPRHLLPETPPHDSHAAFVAIGS